MLTHNLIFPQVTESQNNDSLINNQSIRKILSKRNLSKNTNETRISVDS